MSTHLRILLARVVAWTLARGSDLMATVYRGWQALTVREHSIPIEVLVADRRRRRAIERELRRGLRRLRRIVGASSPADVAIMVQQVITADRQLAGCYHLGQRPDGTPCALLRLALQVDGRRLGTDDLLAVLAEQWIALVQRQNGPGVLVPVNLEPREARPAGHHTLRPDPLGPYPNGTGPHRA